MAQVEILYEDNHLLVAVKPQNIPSQADISGDEDMLTILKKYIKQKYNKPGDVYLGLVHRLDRPTGGIMVFARTSKAAKRLQQQIISGDMQKKYLAVLKGNLSEKSGRLTDYLKKDGETNTVRIAKSDVPGSKKAELLYEIKQEKENYSLAEIELITGRSHQIRVQFASRNAALAGDAKYGCGGHNLCLFAYSLSFLHPTTKEKLCFTHMPPKTHPWTEFKL